jgi:hypothetical protein
MLIPIMRMEVDSACSGRVPRASRETDSKSEDGLMRRLHYGGGQVVIGDAMCKALLRYARALGEANQADIVTIPILSEGGGTETAHFLIGPSSQLFDTPVENSAADPTDPEVVAHLERETLKLHPPTPAWDEELLDLPARDYDIDG